MSDHTMNGPTTPEGGASAASGGDAAPAAGATAGQQEVVHSPSWTWRRRLVRVRRFVRRSFWGLVLLLVAVIALASQTGRGQDIVLRTALNEVRSRLAGELTITGIRSGTLLTGATLRGVRMDAAGGRPFLTADSAVVRYSLLSMITGGSPIRSTTLWGAEIVVARYAEDDPINVSLLVAEGDSVSPSRPRRPTRLGHFALRESTARIISPADDPGEADGQGPDGQPIEELTFEGLDLDVENAVVVPGGSVIFEADLASFSAAIGILDRPLRVREVFGTLTYGDQGIRIFDAAFRLPGTLLEGDLRVGPANPGEPWSFWSDLRTDGWGDLADVAWVDARIPAGRFRGRTVVDADGGVGVTLDEMRVELEASDILFDGRAVFADRMVLDEMRVSASPVTLERLEPWLERDIPLDGWLSGEGLFSGTLDDLTTSGRITLVPTGYGGAATTVDFEGDILPGDSLAARGFRARLDPLNYAVLEALWPQIPWTGIGSATVELDGSVDERLDVVTELVHEPESGAASEVRGRGYVARAADGSWSTDVAADLRPLSIDMFAPLVPELGLGGTISGPARAEGRLDDLHVTGELQTALGRIDVDSRFDLRMPTSGYRVTLAADSFPVARLSQRVPARTHWSGSLTVEGSGASLVSADVRVRATARDSRVGPVRVDTLVAGGRLAGGVLVTDSLRANVGGIDITGRGRLGVVSGRWGSSTLEFSAPSLIGLRPLVMGVGDSVLVRDDLSDLDRELLRVRGIDPDTLPSRVDVRLDGAVEGAASVSGSLADLDLGVIVDVRGGAYRQNAVDSARVGFTATGLPGTLGEWELGATGWGIVLEGREFAQGGFEADMFERMGDGRIEVVRRPGEEYRARGSFALDSVGGRIDLGEASVRIDEQLWELTRAGPIAWGEAMLTVDSIEVVRSGGDPMRLLVDGDLTREGESDFRLVAEGVHLERLFYLAQMEDVGIGGHVDADLLVRGTSRAPLVEGTFSVLGPRYGTVQLTRLEGTVDYADRNAELALEGWDAGRRVLTGSGTVPLDLGLADVERRVLEAPMDIELSTDSLDAAVALAYVTSLDGVLGTVSGDVRVRGTPDMPEPEGTITLRNGAWSIEAIGVRHRGVNGELRLRPDRVVEVSLSARAPGASDVSGTILLEPLSNPMLDLEFGFTRFLAVSRADMEGRVSGQLELQGSYRRPEVGGDLTVDEGTIYVDELQRAADVVDLSNPFLFDAALAVDTMALVSQPLFAGLRNPFFDNMRVNIDLSVPRGTWLRSIDTNVEMTGELLVVYDRSAADFVLIGELEAVRGSHRVLGRTFQLDGGTVVFIGRPGLNPDLDIQASTRIRTPDQSSITIDAQVTGTLVRPLVTLSSEELALSEQDLISYVVFGQPTGALGGRSAAAGRLQDINAVSSAVQGGVTLLGGQLANQLSAALARELTLADYVSVQQGGTQSLGPEAVASAFSQVEIGRYVGEDLFAIVVWRPQAGPEENNLAGVRVEWALTDRLNVEGFVEDRFLRSGSSLLRGSSSLTADEQIWGVFLFREWGYNPGTPPSERNR